MTTTNNLFHRLHQWNLSISDIAVVSVIPVQGARSVIGWRPRSIEVAKRLINAYKNSESQDKGLFNNIIANDLWSIITKDKMLIDILDSINNNDAIKLSEYLCNLGNSDTYYGGLHTCGISSDDTQHEQKVQRIGAHCYLMLIVLAISIGISWNGDDIYQVVHQLNDYFNFNIIPPHSIIPVIGAHVLDSIIHDRHIQSLYQAYLIRKHTEISDSICEYGGGLGLCAYYLYRMGRRNVTLYDLPIANIISGYFLINALGDNAVTLDGENPNNNTIRISSFWNCNKAPNKYYKLSTNQDSFTEIDIRITNIYINEIKRSTTDYFLSINQESESIYGDNIKHLNIPRIIGNTMKLIYRRQFSLRNGYFEELYKIKS